MAAAFPFSFIMFFSFLFFFFFQFRFCFCFCFDFATLHPFLAFFFVRGVLGTVASEAVALSRERRGGRRRGKKGREGIKPNARKGEERDNREGGGTSKRGGNGDKTLGIGIVERCVASFAVPAAVNRRNSCSLLSAASGRC